MPTYEYECKTCGHHFDVFQSMQDEPLKICPECGKEIRRLIFGGSGVIFKGSGFYVNDKSKGSSKTGSANASPTDSAPACKSCPKADSGCGSNKAAG